MVPILPDRLKPCPAQDVGDFGRRTFVADLELTGRQRVHVFIRRLIAAVHHVLATGQMDDRVPMRAGPGDELQELTELFNRMLEKNGALLRGMREALDNVAHDLRTPLTRLRGSAERTLAAPPGPADRETISDALEETERVILLLDTITDISEAETGLMRLARAGMPRAEAVAEAVSLYGDPTTACATLSTLKAQVIRVNLYWGGTKWAVAKSRPSDPTDPGDPAFDWSIYDRLVRYATQNNIKVVFSILFTPGWANGNKARTVSPTNFSDLENFAYAAADRSSELGTAPP